MASAVHRFLTVEELAEYLRVPPSWVYDRTRANGPELIPHVRFGKYIRFDLESEPFRKWLAKHAMEPMLTGV